MIGTAATAAMVSAGINSDPAIHACHAWEACQAEYEDLIKRWQTLEAYLIRNHDWCRLSRRQRAAIPQATELDAIDDRLDEIHDQKQKLLMAVPQASATTPRGLEAKLTVAASVIPRHESAEAHQLIASVLRDFQQMAGSTLE